MSTAIAPQQQQAPQQLTIRDRLKSPGMIAEIGKAMPKHCSPERMARVALTCLTRTPKLARCTQESFFECLLSLSQWGLEPDGRRAHLIPYGDKCTLIIDYKGYVELAYRSGIVRNIHADVVRDGDIFEYNLGRVQKHVPWFLRRDADRPEAAGDVFAAYCTVELVGETVKAEVLSREDVEGIRKRSKASGNGPWVTDWNEMAKKTAFRRVSKWLPLSAEILDAMDRDEDTLTRIEQQPRVRDAGWQMPALPEPAHETHAEQDAEPTHQEPQASDAASPMSQFKAELANALNIGDCGKTYDKWFAPEVTIEWTEEDLREGSRATEERKEQIRAGRGEKSNKDIQASRLV